jgi:peptidyl-prolyl cis-trans isomerase C
LVHFLGAGALLFVALSFAAETPDAASRTITVTERQAGILAERFAQTWQRQPRAREIDGLIRDYIREEIYTREAKRLGLDEDDLLIRRRLRAKMEALAIAEAESAVPSDAELQRFLVENAARYALPARIAFAQRRVDDGPAATLPERMNAPADEIDRVFGDGFAAALVRRQPGPIESGFGRHEVVIEAIEQGEPPSLDALRQRVTNDWRAATQKARVAAAYQALLDGYTIRIEKP